MSFYSIYHSHRLTLEPTTPHPTSILFLQRGSHIHPTQNPVNPQPQLINHSIDPAHRQTTQGGMCPTRLNHHHYWLVPRPDNDKLSSTSLQQANALTSGSADLHVTRTSKPGVMQSVYGDVQNTVVRSILLALSGRGDVTRYLEFSVPCSIKVYMQ